LELIVAVALLSVFLVSLCTGLAAVRARAESLGGLWHKTIIAQEREFDTGTAWTWGPRIIDAQWTPESPGSRVILQLLVALPENKDATPEALVGLWVDGWLLAEISVEASSSSISSPQTLHVDSSFWEGREGKELVVRVRPGEGTWGPPWRTLVPGGEDDAGIDGTDASQAGRHEVIIHTPRLSTARAQVSVNGHPVLASEAGPPMVYSGDVTGRYTSQLEGAVQAWRGEAGRSLDVYY